MMRGSLSHERPKFWLLQYIELTAPECSHSSICSNIQILEQRNDSLAHCCNLLISSTWVILSTRSSWTLIPSKLLGFLPSMYLLQFFYIPALKTVTCLFSFAYTSLQELKGKQHATLLYFLITWHGVWYIVGDQ